MPPKFKQEMNEETIKKIAKLTINETKFDDQKRRTQEKIQSIKRTIDSVSKEPLKKDCPTCHQHEIKVEGVTAKCTGADCGKEYYLMDANTDIECQDCHLPINRDVPNCPYCGGSKGVKQKHGSLKNQLDLLKKDLKR